MIQPISGCAIAYLLSELSIPWNREQTDRLTQVISEVRPRYQETENPAMRRDFCVRIEALPGLFTLTRRSDELGLRLHASL